VGVAEFGDQAQFGLDLAADSVETGVEDDRLGRGGDLLLTTCAGRNDDLALRTDALSRGCGTLGCSSARVAVIGRLPQRFTEALGKTRLGQRAQMPVRSQTRGHQFLGVLVAQGTGVETAQPGDAHALRQPRRREQAGQTLAAAQVAFGVGVERKAGLIDTTTDADGGEGVVQRLVATLEHGHIADAHAGHAQPLAEGVPLRHPVGLVGPQQTPHTQPRPAGHLPHQWRSGLAQRRRVGKDDRQTTRHAVVQIGPRDAVAILVAGHAHPADEPAQRGVADTILRQQHQVQVAPQHEARTGDERQTGLARRLPGAHHATDRTEVGERQRAVAEFMRPTHQIPGLRGAAQETEGRGADQFGVIRARHATLRHCRLRRRARFWLPRRQPIRCSH